MRAEELRIGNCVHFDMNNPREDNEPEQGYVDHIITAKDLNDKETIERLTPIPLTEEWLLKLGMKKDGYDYWSGPVYFELAECRDGEYINSVNSHEYDHGIKIKYVHSLQNLYFALTGEELKLNN